MTPAQRKVVWIWLAVFILLALFPPNYMSVASCGNAASRPAYDRWTQGNDILFALYTPIKWDVLLFEQLAALIVAAVCFLTTLLEEAASKATSPTVKTIAENRLKDLEKKTTFKDDQLSDYISLVREGKTPAVRTRALRMLANQLEKLPYKYWNSLNEAYLVLLSDVATPQARADVLRDYQPILFKMTADPIKAQAANNKIAEPEDPEVPEKPAKPEDVSSASPKFESGAPFYASQARSPTTLPVDAHTPTSAANSTVSAVQKPRDRFEAAQKRTPATPDDTNSKDEVPENRLESLRIPSPKGTANPLPIPPTGGATGAQGAAGPSVKPTPKPGDK